MENLAIWRLGILIEIHDFWCFMVGFFIGFCVDDILRTLCHGFWEHCVMGFWEHYVMGFWEHCVMVYFENIMSWVFENIVSWFILRTLCHGFLRTLCRVLCDGILCEQCTDLVDEFILADYFCPHWWVPCQPPYVDPATHPAPANMPPCAMFCQIVSIILIGKWVG